MSDGCNCACGTADCCKYINLGRILNFPPQQKEYLRAHGVVEDQGFFLIPFRCPHLATSPKDSSEFNKIVGENYCDIHDHKPKICADWNGKKFQNHMLIWVPRNCSLAKKEVKHEKD